MLWGGDLGGAESVSAATARVWRHAGADARVVFVTTASTLGDILDADGVPHVSVGLRRGRDVLLQPRRVARALVSAPDGALLADAGNLAASLRLGGYRGRLVAVEHGKVLAVPALSRAGRIKDRIERVLTTRFRSADVGVSKFVVDALRGHPHASRLLCIPNGIDTDRFSPLPESTQKPGQLRIGCAARLIPGKGIDRLLDAVARLPAGSVAITIAGQGPERASLEFLARDLGVRDVVTFAGSVHDMPGFWRMCDVAVVPSDTFVESFSMSALEAMACGVPVVGTAIGGVPEVLSDGESGVVVAPGDSAVLADALDRYRVDPALRRRHGVAGARRAREMFSIETTAGRYLDVLVGESA